jgi:molybdopterin converting factor small subunit
MARNIHDRFTKEWLKHYLQETLRHISILQINLKLRHNKTKDIKEVIMNLSPAYEKWHEETIAIGEARGRNLERIAIAKTMLQEGAAIALITKVTGFSATEIEQLSLDP